MREYRQKKSIQKAGKGAIEEKCKKRRKARKTGKERRRKEERLHYGQKDPNSENLILFGS